MKITAATVVKGLFILSILFIFNDCINAQSMSASPIPGDVSGMFNERGYYKSESVKSDEEESINNFNGNLQYVFPLYQSKEQGDLSFSMSLNYNGSVNYQSINATPSYATFNKLPRQNFSAPAWIVSVNGFAVQMFDFETRFFTAPVTQVQSEIKNENIHLLATGYHLTDNLVYLGEGEKDVICIMHGDGSVVYLENLQACNSNNFSQAYIGEYYSEALGDYTRAHVEYLDNDTQISPTYRNRRLSLMQGDGITYIFEEQKIQYCDFTYYTNSADCFRPQIFLLRKIKDKFGHEINLSYTTYSTWGRPVITNINTGSNVIDISYVPFGTAFQLKMQVNNNDNYIVNCFDQSGGFDTTGNHRLYPSELIYPNGSEFNFTHEKYYRTALYVYNPISTNQLNFKFDNDNGLKRLKTITNVYGGKREYEYIGGANEVSIYMNPTDGNKIMSNAVNVEYFGQGRDVFFVNMVLNKKVYNKTDLINNVDWTYNYNTNRLNYRIDPINPQDDYTTNILTSNPDGKEIYYTPQSRQIKYLYKDYKLKENSNKSEYPDWEGHSKLISALEYLTDTINFFKKTTYLFSGGTFLDTAIIENYANTAEKRTSFRYDLFSLDSRIEQNYNPVKKTVKIDPFGQRTEILNDFIYKTSRHYALGLYNPRGSQSYDSTYYYNIQLPVSKKNIQYKRRTFI